MSGSTQQMPGARRSLRRHMIGVSVLALALVAGVGGWAAKTELSSAIVAGGVVVVDLRDGKFAVRCPQPKE